MVGSSRSADRLRDVIGCVTHGRLIARPVPGGIGETLIEFEDPAPVRTGGALRGSAIDARLQPAVSSGAVYSTISVHRLEHLMVPRFCWLLLRLQWSLYSM